MTFIPETIQEKVVCFPEFLNSDNKLINKDKRLLFRVEDMGRDKGRGWTRTGSLHTQSQPPSLAVDKSFKLGRGTCGVVYNPQGESCFLNLSIQMLHLHSCPQQKRNRLLILTVWLREHLTALSL